ncbi:HoxN/HupN/NixA family nickel/cobalt transporter [Oceanomicrobium pacificus]|uniref:Nickel/cobalt efflux system n=1 Tax=Oceanomicrobium pacificus TaxID=2692916 RepID=A0A6B0TLH2_9RHOB|nr:DUF3299 domain-containing protein [Oceanomicrobium pacificus]MXU65357.1 DUF3299 domain-containing protein [Oceanomicrobium pacificus]
MRLAGFWKIWASVAAAVLTTVLFCYASAVAASDRTLVSWDVLAPVEAGAMSTAADGATANTVAAGLVGTDILIDGYVLPLAWEHGRVVDFLLVPWVGACIHTPAPPPNQMITVTYPGGIDLAKPYEPARIAGTLRHEPAEQMLFHVDGSRPVETSYVLEDAVLAGTPGRVFARSASDVPFVTRAQIWVNSLFTDSMTALGQGGSTRALLFALLLSFGYGAFHTLGPGHGKTVVISYFVGTGGSLRRGVTMGVRIAVFHVFSAIAIVFLFDFTVRQTTGGAPSDFRAVRLASYGLIIAIGSVMLWQALAAIRAYRSSRRNAAASGTVAHDHDHTHVSDAHHHDHDHHAHDHHEHGHTHGPEHHHDHTHAHSGCAACAAAAAPKGGGWLAASVGIVPCTGALIIMLFGLANDLIWPAIVMVVAISAGMAVAMSAIGIAAIWSRNWVEGRIGSSDGQRERFALGARLAGAACVLAIGLTLFGLTLTFQPVPVVPTAELAMRTQ